MKTFAASFVLIMLLVGAGCDWRVFDDLAEQATVQAVEPPKNFSGTNFGQVVSPVLNEQGQVISDVYVAGGNGTSPLAVLTLEPGGTVSRQAYTFDEGVSVSAIASLPAADGRWRVVLADGRYQSVTIFSLNPVDDSAELRREATVSGGAEFGGSLVVADLDREGGMEIVVASAQGLTVFDETLDTASSRFFRYPDDFQVPSLQELTEHGNQSFLSVLQVGGNPVIAVGGHTTNENEDEVWTVLLVPFTVDFPAVTPERLVGGAEAPGALVCTLASGLIDADDETDLVVGVCEATYVFLAANGSPQPYAATPRWTLSDDPLDLGHVAGLVDLDADGRPELCIGEPDRPAGSGRNGVVQIYELDGASPDALEPLTVLSAPENEKHFGSSLLPLKTGTGTELVVGGSNASYLFFLTGYPGDADPR